MILNDVSLVRDWNAREYWQPASLNQERDSKDLIYIT